MPVISYSNTHFYYIFYPRFLHRGGFYSVGEFLKLFVIVNLRHLVLILTINQPGLFSHHQVNFLSYGALVPANATKKQKYIARTEKKIMNSSCARAYLHVIFNYGISITDRFVFIHGSAPVQVFTDVRHFRQFRYNWNCINKLSDFSLLVEPNVFVH